MNGRHHSRRHFLETGIGAALGTAAAPLAAHAFVSAAGTTSGNVVSVARIRDGRIASAVEEAVDLLGGIETVAKGKSRIMLKPNLVADLPTATTKPEVVGTLARLMKSAGREVLIGEGSAAADGFNVKGGVTYRTRKRDILDGMQQRVFDRLGYSDLARSLRVPLVNLHSGELVDVPLDGGLAFDKLTLHQSLTDIDLLCSVPMMKTHGLATVTLSMKNLIGLYPGTVYYSVRSWLHDRANEKGSPGVAYEIVDMVRANRTGLAVIDASSAMQGNGPAMGTLVDMNLIVAGTSPLAADMVATALMGIDPAEVPTFACAHRVGMGPRTLDEIEVRGLRIDQAKRAFVRPSVVPWASINRLWGVKEL
jgi:uncharacterized protein (DUF362 family)